MGWNPLKKGGIGAASQGWEGVKSLAKGDTKGAMDHAKQAAGSYVDMADVKGLAKAQAPKKQAIDESGMQKSLADYQNAIGDYVKNGNTQYQNAGDQGPSAYNGIQVDPQYADHERAALRDLEQQSKDGFSARDLADLAQSDSNVNRQNAGRIGAIQQGMAARGMGGSGMEMVAQMQAAQDATERQALASMEKNAQAQEGRRQATAQMGQLSGQLSSRDFQQQAQKAAAQDSIARFNKTNAQQVMNNNTQGQNQFQGNVLNARHAGSQMQYNAGADAANRATTANQSKQAGFSGMLGTLGTVGGGIAGGMYGGPAGAMAGASAGGSVGQGLGNYVQNYAHGGTVGGRAPYPGDDPRNDVIPAMLSPGEVVIPRSQVQQADPFADMDAMVAEHMRKKLGGVDAAQKQSDMAGYAGIAAQAGDMLANANNQPKALYNRMEDLGKAPTMVGGQQQHTDMSGIQRIASDNLKSATSDRDEALQAMLQQRKEEMAREIMAKKAAADAQKDDRNFGQKDREINANIALRQTNAEALAEQRKQSAESRQRDFENKTGQQQDKAYSDLGVKTSLGRGTPQHIQKAAEALRLIEQAKSIVNDYPNLDDIPSQQVNLLNGELAKIATGGVATEGGRHELGANTMASKYADFRSRVGNNPTGAELGSFIKENLKYLEGLKGVNGNLINQYHADTYKSYKHRLSPDQQAEFENDHPELFNKQPAAPATPEADTKMYNGIKMKKVPGGWVPAE